jgi:hypothetical protein
MKYRERLWPATWVWILMLGFAGMLAWALAFALGLNWGLSTLGACAILITFSVTATLPTVTVTESGIHVDRAFLPMTSVGDVRALDAAEMNDALHSTPGPTYLAVRPWACREGVLLHLDDSSDPHSYWLVSSRHPQRLAEAILTANAGHARDRLAPGRGE